MAIDLNNLVTLNIHGVHYARTVFRISKNGAMFLYTYLS